MLSMSDRFLSPGCPVLAEGVEEDKGTSCEDLTNYSEIK